MKLLIIFALLCVALSARAAAVPVESDAVVVEETKTAPEEAVEVEAPAAEEAVEVEAPAAEEAVEVEAPVAEEAVEVEAPVAEEKLRDAPEEDVPTEAVKEVAAAPEAARRFCPDGWFSYQSKCYMFVNTPRSWFGAEEHCNELGASLASASSSPEYRYLQQITRTANRATAWIGGFYLQVRERVARHRILDVDRPLRNVLHQLVQPEHRNQQLLHVPAICCGPGLEEPRMWHTIPIHLRAQLSLLVNKILLIA
ncbi:CD209 antigen-like isoform X1 [Oncorhynchus masou masou]|uniref:CD209 antigen-like isoform X1 n=1 Tax=Oncorhynchus masou masou TaxID=90313 RepID=UPI0031841453